MAHATETLSNGNTVEYNVTEDGTAYHAQTDPKIVQLLQDARRMGTRLVIELGDVETGRAWGDVETGRIGRSGGSIKIPLAVYNSRSSGGCALLDHCIVRIRTASGKLLVYQHPNYQAA